MITISNEVIPCRRDYDNDESRSIRWLPSLPSSPASTRPSENEWYNLPSLSPQIQKEEVNVATLSQVELSIRQSSASSITSRAVVSPSVLVEVANSSKLYESKTPTTSAGSELKDLSSDHEALTDIADEQENVDVNNQKEPEIVHQSIAVAAVAAGTAKTPSSAPAPRWWTKSKRLCNLRKQKHDSFTSACTLTSHRVTTLLPSSNEACSPLKSNVDHNANQLPGSTPFDLSSEKFSAKASLSTTSTELYSQLESLKPMDSTSIDLSQTLQKRLDRIELQCALKDAWYERRFCEFAGHDRPGEHVLQTLCEVTNSLKLGIVDRTLCMTILLLIGYMQYVLFTF